MTTNKAGKFQSVLNTRALWIDDHALRCGDIVNDVTTLAGATLKAALSTLATISSAQLLTNKSFEDASTFFVNSADNTKKVKLNLATLTTGTTYTWFPPPQSGVYLLHGASNNGTQISGGYNSFANGANATAFGASSSASGQNSMALGQNAVASGQYATAGGFNALCANIGTTAFGSGPTTGANYATSFGFQATSYQNSSAFGSGANANGTDITCVGANATSYFNGCSVLGRNATATAVNQFVVRVGNSAVTELITPLTTDATARATLVTHLPVTLNGVTYYIKLYQT